MPVPPPPPPPPPAPPPPPPPCTAHPPQSRPDPPSLQSVGGRGGRNALLVDIQKGAKLKKVLQVHDRSAPVVDKPRASGGLSQDHPQGGSGGGVEAVRPSLGGLFSGGFPILRPAGQRGKNVVSRSSSSTGLKPQWNPPPTSSDSGHTLEPYHRPTERGSPAHSASAPPSPSHSKPPLSITAPATTPPPPHPSFHERPSSRPPPIPTGPPPPPPTQVTKPTWLPIQHPHPLPQPSTPPPSTPPSSLPNRNSGFFYPSPPSPILSLLPPPSSLPRHIILPPPPSPVLSTSSELRFSISGPHGPPPPPPPPLPASFTPSCPSSLPPPPPKMPPVPSPAMRPPVPPSYPCTAPSRRPPAVPRSAGVGRSLASPPVPPARSPSTELTNRIPPPHPPPLPPSLMRNGHSLSWHSLDDFESKFQFHPIEDFPPPEEFWPFPRIYPSRENQGVTRTQLW
ncbi:LOW QUALITY PROTEIN: WAS/WASL-interacting protein family member 3-like [Oncorhynchus masou masou]|uniref:LOW QUALITY PROTEIN: WAS/WASL-interacting protein family member 3-like n=1 Tax=Oncorhynchus masou masou TaxID=90313 RepID=UPI003183DB53